MSCGIVNSIPLEIGNWIRIERLWEELELEKQELNCKMNWNILELNIKELIVYLFSQLYFASLVLLIDCSK